MSQAGDTFFTSVGCMDGRVQKPIADFGKAKFGAIYPDTITEAGLVGLLGKQNPDQALIDAIKFKIGISVEKHSSKGIVIHGHESCAGNPVEEDQHKKDILKTAELVKSLFPDNEIIPVYVKKVEGEWTVEEL